MSVSYSIWTENEESAPCASESAVRACVIEKWPSSVLDVARALRLEWAASWAGVSRSRLRIQPGARDMSRWLSLSRKRASNVWPSFQ